MSYLIAYYLVFSLKDKLFIWSLTKHKCICFKNKSSYKVIKYPYKILTSLKNITHDLTILQFTCILQFKLKIDNNKRYVTLTHIIFLIQNNDL